ncbi:hypothetical protein [Prevotella corporis]|uniref:hypothetical protein n=1 Tax=Prevotella corporis TaxID=28128 RepID=UPI001EE16E63|nr:hypothetical protein [Prevotella corporis]
MAAPITGSFVTSSRTSPLVILCPKVVMAKKRKYIKIMDLVRFIQYVVFINAKLRQCGIWGNTQKWVNYCKNIFQMRQ